MYNFVYCIFILDYMCMRFMCHIYYQYLSLVICCYCYSLYIFGLILLFLQWDGLIVAYVEIPCGIICITIWKENDIWYENYTCVYACACTHVYVDNDICTHIYLYVCATSLAGLLKKKFYITLRIKNMDMNPKSKDKNVGLKF